MSKMPQPLSGRLGFELRSVFPEPTRLVVRHWKWGDWWVLRRGECSELGVGLREGESRCPFGC